MIRLSIFFWLALSFALSAQTVAIKSGDHPDFTRLVLQLPNPSEWKMGRTSEGYELKIADKELKFDLTRTFDTIGRDRLASIWVDPATGTLRLGIACACHALPFEFRPGIIVIDLRNGPPPNQSSFELALDGTDTQELRAKANQRPRKKPANAFATEVGTVAQIPPYNWLQNILQVLPEARMASSLMPEQIYDESNHLKPIRDTLLLQLSRGAAQGLVQMAQPDLSARQTEVPIPIGPRANIYVGDVSGFEASTLRKPANNLVSKGAECISDQQLDVREWGTDDPVPFQLAKSRTNLVGEFDLPQTDVVKTATKLLIYLGFGAEAQQILAQLAPDDPERALWNSMAKLVDGGTDALGPFAGMQSCDGAAALWAALAIPQFSPSESPRPEAVLREFSALPAHLRSNLGPDLAEKFIAIDDVATARSLATATQRGSADAGPKLVVLAAAIDLATGDPAKATAELEPILPDSGPAAAETLIALVNAQVAAGIEIDVKTPIALAALIHEQSGSSQEPALRRAQILALGSSGDFDQAFGLLAKMPSAEMDLWKLLSQSKADTAILSHAVLPEGAVPPALAEGDRSQIAGRLLALGLPGAALDWIGPSSQVTTDAARLIAANASLAKGSPEDVLGWTEGVSEKSGLELRARALWQLGKPKDAATVWAAAGNTEAELRAQSWAENWETLANTETSGWQPAAATVALQSDQNAFQTAGPLALGNALIADSAKTRGILSGLLADIPRLNAGN